MEQIAFIGTGIMGHPMARNLLRAGYRVKIYNRTPTTGQDLTDAGGQLAKTLQEAVADATVVITMLPDTPDVRSVYFESAGVLANCRPGTLLIDMSTVAPEFSQELATAAEENACMALDAPVSGGQNGAEQGTLSIMIGGSTQAFERAKPLFEVMGSHIVRIGGPGAGQVAKACNQIAVAANIAGVAEALRLAESFDVDGSLVQEALLGGLAQSRVLESHGTRMLRRNFKPGFRLRLHLKDLQIAVGSGNVHLPVTSLVRDLMADRVTEGMGDWDHSALYIDID